MEHVSHSYPMPRGKGVGIYSPKLVRYQSRLSPEALDSLAFQHCHMGSQEPASRQRAASFWQLEDKLVGTEVVPMETGSGHQQHLLHLSLSCHSYVIRGSL